ncbi:MAG: S41 family peptidase [Acidobacteriota bacterium]|nr:S41 family peptidase [Acidobacteriota bacterium]
MSLFYLTFYILLCNLLFINFAWAQNKQSTSTVSAEDAQKWREDLRYMAEQMPIFHKNLFHTMSREQFDAAIKRLHERIPQLARHQIIVEMAKIVAMVDDGHTNIYPTRDPKIGFRALPVKLYLFKDGMFVRAAEREHAALVGARVTKIGNFSVEESIAKVQEMLGRDNEMGLRFFAPHLLIMPEVLHAFGIVGDMENVPLSIEKGGKQEIVTLKPAGLAEMLPPDTDTTWINKPNWVDMRDGATNPQPLWLKDPNDKYRFEYFPETRIVYAQMNQGTNKEKETIADFAKRLFAFVEANPVEKLIIDLRLNRGGNGMLFRPLETAIIKSKINERGKLFVLMGRSTWSASQFLLNNLEEYTNVIFVGEPSASKGNVYGDSRRITLPNSGMTVRVSVYYWQDWAPWDTRFWTAPEIAAEFSSEDYRANRDPGMEAILNYSPKKSLTEVIDEALTKGGVELAVKSYRDFMAQPAHRYAYTEQPLLEGGQRLLNEKKPEQALVLFKLNAEANPHSFRAYFALGETYTRIGNKELAILNLEKSLAINPKTYDVLMGLKKLKQQK